MTVAHTARLLRRVPGVRTADKRTNRMSFSGILPWFDIENLMGPGIRDGSSFEAIIEAESLLEHDFVVLKRLDGSTREIRQQPRRLKWWDPRTRQWRLHIPDFELLSHGSERVVFAQVKPAEIAAELKEELDLIRDAFEHLGHGFEVWTEVEIRAQPRFRNAQLLYGHTGPLENVEALAAVRKVLRDTAPEALTIGEIREAAGVGGMAFRAVLRLHVRGEVALDLDRPIIDGAMVRPLGRAAPRVRGS